MIKIGLCDDTSLYIDDLSKILKKIAKSKNIEIELTSFDSSQGLLDFYLTHPNYYDILFLDIIMDNMNGIELAKQLRKLTCNAYIIFGTTSKEFALDSYSVDAFKYVLKPYIYEDLDEIMTQLSSKLNFSKKNIVYVKNNQDIYSFNLDEVVYFESNLRKIIAHLNSGENLTFYNKMSTFESEIDSNTFVRCHRSFLVNLSYLKNIVGANLITTTNEEIPISKKYLVSTRDIFTNFIQSKL